MRKEHPTGFKFSYTICLSSVEQKQKESIHLMALLSESFTLGVLFYTKTHSHTSLAVGESLYEPLWCHIKIILLQVVLMNVKELRCQNIAVLFFPDLVISYNLVILKDCEQPCFDNCNMPNLKHLQHPLRVEMSKLKLQLSERLRKRKHDSDDK